MHKNITALIIMLALPLACLAQRSQDDYNLPLVTVTGEAEIRVVPDEIILSLGVETSDKLLERSKSNNDERVKRILALGPAFGIDPKHLQTSFIGIEPWYREYNRVESLEYRVRRTIAITLKDTSKFESLLSRSIEVGATNVHGIQLRTTELRKHRDAARALAIKAAREKAIALAGELDQKIGKAVRIQESGSGWYSPYGWWGSVGGTSNVMQNSANSGSASSTDGTLALGQITVTANVSVTFLLQ